VTKRADRIARVAATDRGSPRKVLIANRGEIAVRIARTCRAMGLGTVAVYSAADRSALHVRIADEAVEIGPAAVALSYLNADALLDAAARSGADTVHPGYGFLSENAAFARRVRDAGLLFVGPTAEAIAAMGDKLVARAHAAAAGVPLVPGTDLLDVDGDRVGSDVAAHAARLGYPVLVKAAAGGGGRGMRVVTDAAALADAVGAATREAAAAFGDGRVYLEKYFVRPRHVEIQILADTHGTVVHLGERECSIQRRHQKILEETPAPGLDPALRTAIADAAVAIARRVAYSSAGTVEFLVAADGSFYFLEMNTRLQVEHPVTEWVTGLDLVREQLRIAAGARLGFAQTDIRPTGAAIECRLYAEDPALGFLPSAGLVRALREPSGPGVRVDSCLEPGTLVPVEYDPLLAKVSTWGPTRAIAIERMTQALAETAVVGPATNIAFLGDIVRDPRFREGATHTDFIAERFPRWASDAGRRDLAAIVAALVLGGAAAVPTPPGNASIAALGTTDGSGARTVNHDSPWARLGPWRVCGS
jgi:acetyl-CoA carboxylase biotin carboxylase subunit